LISGESLTERKRRASEGYDTPECNSDKKWNDRLENFAKRNVLWAEQSYQPFPEKIEAARAKAAPSAARPGAG
jgi:hypothetical protein